MKKFLGCYYHGNSFADARFCRLGMAGQSEIEVTFLAL